MKLPPDEPRLKVADVVDLPVVTRLPINVRKVIRDAYASCKDGTLVCMGYDSEGEFFFSSSEPDGPEVLWLLRTAEMRLLQLGKAFMPEDKE